MSASPSPIDAALAPLLQPVWDYLAISEPPRQSDVVFVFGCRDLAVPAQAADLVLAGHASRVLVSGSYGRLTRGVFDKPEALVFTDHLVNAGVPARAIVVEPRATNTLENVRFGMAALAAQGCVPRTALLVAKGFVMRRAVATFAQQCAGVRVCPCPPPGGMPEALDRSGTAFAARLVAELDRLDRYAACGDIQQQSRPASVSTAAAAVRAWLRVATASARRQAEP